MVLKLYGGIVATCTKRVATVFHEKNIPFQLHPINFIKAEHKTPEFRIKQPFGQMPYLDDDGFIVYESRAICRYLEDKFPDQGNKLIPSDVRERALFEQGVSIESSNFDSLVSPLLYEAIYKPEFLGETPDLAKIEECKAGLAVKLDVYEKILSRQKYIAGDRVTLADLFHLPYGSLLPKVGIHFIQERPHVAKWFEDIQNRPSWQAVKDRVESRV